jgi:hypothetical protein
MLRRIFAPASIAFLSILISTSAMATAQRTFVASNGNDANPCSLPQPCRGFARAITQTSAGGEVIVQDSAGYGPVTISQSVSIIAPAGVYAGVSVLSGDGITIGASASDVVTLKGLTVNSQGGSNGIVVTSVAQLRLEGLTVSGFAGGAAILVSGPTPTLLTLKDSVFRSSDYGLSLPNASAGQIVIDNVHLENHGIVAVYVQSSAGSGEVHLTIDNSVISGFSIGGTVRVLGGVAGAIAIRASIMRTTFAGPGSGRGVVTAGVLTVATLADCHVSGWGIGVEVLNGPSGVATIQSLRNNLFIDNTDNGSANPVTPF